MMHAGVGAFKHWPSSTLPVCPFGPKLAHAAFVHCRYILDSPTLHRALGDQRSFMDTSMLSKDWVQVSVTSLTGWHAVVVCP